MLLPPGSGHLSIGVAADPIGYGAFAEYQQRLKKQVSLFAEGRAGMSFRGQPDWQAMGGFRWEW